MDYTGCEYDSECTGNKKCCSLSNCGYKECMDENTELDRLDCPSALPFELLEKTNCTSDSDCGYGELCCEADSENGKECIDGVSVLPKGMLLSCLVHVLCHEYRHSIVT